MSSNIIKINGQPNSSIQKDYICDSIEDIAKLPRHGVYGTIKDTTDDSINAPCAIGSTALVCNGESGSSVYILSPSNEWVVM